MAENNNLDWPIVLSRLEAKGVGGTKLSKLLGVTAQHLSQIKTEAVPPPKAWDQALLLFGTYLEHVGTNDLPIFGENNL